MPPVVFSRPGKTLKPLQGNPTYRGVGFRPARCVAEARYPEGEGGGPLPKSNQRGRGA
jgi:hypothetical protein